MAEKDRKDKNTNEKSRRSPALALLLVLLIAAVFFIMSDVPFIKSARDAVMQKFGYESVDTETEEPDNGGGTIAAGSTTLTNNWSYRNTIYVAADLKDDSVRLLVN